MINLLLKNFRFATYDKLPLKILQKIFWNFFSQFTAAGIYVVFQPENANSFEVTLFVCSLWVQLECNGRGSPVTAPLFDLLFFAMQCNSISFCILVFSLSLHTRRLGTFKNKEVVEFYFCVSVHRSISQIKHQLDATLCRFYFCSHSTCFGRQAPIIRSIKKLARRPLV